MVIKYSSIHRQQPSEQPKEQLATICKTNAVGQHWISHNRHKTKLTKRECRKAILLFREEGRSPEREYPSQSCVFKWFKTSTETSVQTYVTVTPHAAHLDRYTATLVDPGFLGGVCSEVPCDLLRDSMMWYSENKIKSGCPSYRTVGGGG